ncbi:MAG TPA: hypothetical protein VFI97_09305 [Arthrobacter sp.]|nr:hypothetical protein [Arthrobacter sp.]
MGVAGRIYAVVAVLFWAVLPGFGIIDLTTMFADNSFYASVAALETSWGVLFTFIVALAFAAAAVRPEYIWPAMTLIWLTTAALLAAGLLGLQWQPAVVGLVLGIMSLGLVLTARHAQIKPPLAAPKVHWLLLGLAIAALPFWWFYAAAAFAMSRAGGSPSQFHTVGVDHWPVQGALGLTLATGALVAALWPAMRSLFRVSLSLSAATLGASWLMHPSTVGGIDNRLLATAAVVWAVMIALTANAERLPRATHPLAA